jgi:hypothetical protein
MLRWMCVMTKYDSIRNDLAEKDLAELFITVKHNYTYVFYKPMHLYKNPSAIEICISYVFYLLL